MNNSEYISKIFTNFFCGLKEELIIFYTLRLINIKIRVKKWYIKIGVKKWLTHID